ncbi:MAG: TonB-dependent receptor [Bacteroidetes bacterium]|jgi:iron complex outermembrane receptor protein|nr:TonB-dependent receptor [Bacteroidota bacterium]
MRSFVVAVVGLIMAAGSWLSAQPTATVRLTGTVRDSATSLPLDGASVFVAHARTGVLTDTEGRFVFPSLQPGRHEVVVRMMGYAEVRRTIVLAKPTQLDIFLVQVSIAVRGVTITGTVDKSGLMGSHRAISVVGADDLHRLSGQTLGETLEHLPGVTLISTGPSIMKPVIRGLHSQRIVLLNADIRQEGQQWGAEHAPEIDPFAGAGIEVVKGPASVEFGAEAIGGVVRIVPRELRRTQGHEAELHISFFSNNAQGAVSGWMEGHADVLSDVAWRLQGSARRAGDARAPAYGLANTGFSEVDGSFTIGYLFEAGEVSALLSRFSTDLGIFQGSHIGNVTDLRRAIVSSRPLVERPFSYDIRMPKQVIRHDLVTLRARSLIEGLGSLDLRLGRQENHRQEYDALRIFGQIQTRPAFDLTLTSYTADLRLMHLPVGPFTGTIGLSGTRQGNVSEGTTRLIPNFRAHNVGAFAIEEWSDDGLRVTTGVRLDWRQLDIYRPSGSAVERMAKTYANVSGAVGVQWQFDPTWSLGTNIGTAWRPPSLNELYSDGVHHGSAQYEIGDPTLGNERSGSLDVTLRHIAEMVHVDVSVFVNRIDGFIALFPTPDPTLTVRGAFPTFRYRQDDVVMHGLDGSAEWHVNTVLRLGLSGSLVRGSIVSTRLPMLFLPGDRARFIVHAKLPERWGLTGSYVEATVIGVRHQGRYPSSVDYANPPPGYVLLDLETGTHLHWGEQVVEVTLSTQNVLNTTYRDYLSRFRYFSDDPGRSFVVRVSTSWGRH